MAKSFNKSSRQVAEAYQRGYEEILLPKACAVCPMKLAKLTNEHKCRAVGYTMVEKHMSLDYDYVIKCEVDGCRKGDEIKHVVPLTRDEWRLMSKEAFNVDY